MPTTRKGFESWYGLKVSPTFTPLFTASTRSMAISSGLVGHRPVSSTWSQAPGTDTSRGMDGAPLPLISPTSGSCCHTIGWPCR